MVESRNRRVNPLAFSAMVLIVLAVSFGASSSGRAGNEPATPAAYEEVTPLSQATTDDVEFGLIEWGTDDSGYFVIEVRVHNLGSLPVRLEEHLVSLSISSASGELQRDLLLSTPSLPCAIDPGDRLTVRFSFDVAEGETPLEITIGISEINRTGARVIFPLKAGAGASAVGGSGLPGNDASSTPTADSTFADNSNPHPASPVAGGCQN